MSLYQSDRLLGRSAEEAILLNSYFASLSKGTNSPASVILIHGDSGLGKTKLAESLRPHVLGDDGFFIRGKFDQLSYGSANRPYSGISSAFAEYCSAVEQRRDDTWSEVVTKLKREIKAEEGRLLFEAIPSLRKIIGGECHRDGAGKMHRRHSCEACEHFDEEEGTPGIFSESGSHRFIYLIKRVVSVISSIGDPIACLIDDIQWANKTEIDVLKALMAEAKNPFLFIFTCRPGNHPFLDITNEIGEKTEVMLQSLKRDSVRELVAEMLRISDVEECTSLANFVSRVTNGNPFFIRQQMISLRDDGLLRYGNTGWIWDIEEIEGVHDGALGIENVVVMLSQKMRKLPPLTQEVLKICSSIGSKIDLHILGLLVRYTRFVEDSDTDTNEEVAKLAIRVALEEGLLAITENGEGVAFTHDSVNEAAYSLLLPEERETYHLKLGQTLMKAVCQNLLRKYIYTIAAQLARGIALITDDNGRIETARIFLSAGEKSMAASAYPEAHFFISKSTSLLREEDWTTHYNLCCETYMKAADTAALTSDFRDMESCLAVLFDHCRGSLVDYINATYIKVRWLASKDSPVALDTGLEALRMAGEKYPTQNFLMHTLLGLAKTRSAVKSKGADKLQQLPRCQDPEIIAILRLLNVLTTLSIAWNQSLLPLLCFRVIQLNLKHGMSDASPSAVAMYGALLGRMGFPLKEAVKYADIAITMQDKLENKEHQPHTAYLTYGVLFSQTRRLSENIKPLKAGYDAGAKTGNITHAMSCAQMLGYNVFFSGQKLTKVASTLDHLKASLSEHNMVRAIRANRLYRIAVDYFLGVTSASRFYSSTMTDDSISGSKKTNLIIAEQAKFITLVAASIFGDHDVAWSVAEKLGQFSSAFSGTVWPYVCAFYRGIAAVSVMQTLPSRQAKTIALSCFKELKKGMKKKVVNISHHFYLLRAECAAYRRKHSLATKLYSLAVEHASSSGVTFEHAYACERFGAYHLLRQDHNAAYEQIREAHRLYAKWGSRPKCNLLKKKYPKLDEEERFHPINI